MFGEVLFNYGIINSPLPFLVTLALSANLGAVLALLAVLGNMPLTVPSNRVKKEDIVRFLIFMGAAFMRYHWICHVFLFDNSPYRDTLSVQKIIPLSGAG